MRLLVVEDDSKIASFIVKGFKESGFAVDHYANGSEGLTFALSEPYAAVVLDIMLPGLDGLSLVQEMRKNKVGDTGAAAQRQGDSGRPCEGTTQRRRRLPDEAVFVRGITGPRGGIGAARVAHVGAFEPDRGRSFARSFGTESHTGREAPGVASA